MNGVVRPIALALVFCGLTVPAAAQNAPAGGGNSLPDITIMISGAQELKNDLKFVIDLGNPLEQKQWDNVNETLETFLPGIDQLRPVRIDLLIDNKKLTFRSHFPVNAESMKVFRLENLVAFGIKSTPKGRNYWSLAGGGFAGFMRYDNAYATIAETAAAVPANAPDPAIALAPLVAKKFDLAALVKNSKNTPDDLKKRGDALEELRKELDALIKPLPDESEEEFSLRKLVSQHQFTELKRFVVEAEELTLGWTTDVPNKVGLVDFDMTALKDTDLEKSIMQLAAAPGLFQVSTRSEAAIMSLKTNFPLDPMRQQHLSEMFAQIRLVASKKISAMTELNETEKAAGQKVIDLFVKLLDDGTKLGIIDSYSEITTDTDGKHGILGGMLIPETGVETIRELLKTVPEIKAGNTVEFDVETVGDVALHKVHLVSGGIPMFEKWLGTEVDFWIATGPKSAWIAEGEKADERLKVAIQQVTSASAPTETSPLVIDFFLKVQPWIALNAEKAKEPTKPKLRELIEESFIAGEDVVTFTLARFENRTEGRFRAHQGFMRFIGKVVSKFSAENLK